MNVDSNVKVCWLVPWAEELTKRIKFTLISFRQVDAIVNSTSSDLDLSRNASAKALSAAAGPKLQQECSAIGQVRTGGIVVTGGGNLGCKHVFHTSCASWETGKGEQVSNYIRFSNSRICMGL